MTKEGFHESLDDIFRLSAVLSRDEDIPEMEDVRNTLTVGLVDLVVILSDQVDRLLRGGDGGAFRSRDPEDRPQCSQVGKTAARTDHEGRCNPSSALHGGHPPEHLEGECRP